MKRILGLMLALTSATAGTAMAEASPSLRGSNASMVQQNQVAKAHGLAFYRTAADIRAAVAEGVLVRLEGNENYEVADFVNHPYLQPDGVLFVERLSQQYREACGQKLVVTSAVRPTNGQPSNSHRLSVHPAGMAVDLRVSDSAACRSWLEGALLGMNARGVINGIREFRPPHYHVAVFPTQYREYAEERMAIEAVEAQALEAERLAQAEAEAAEAAAANAALMEAAGATALVASEQERSKSDPFLLAAVAIVAIPLGLRVLLQRTRRRQD